MSAPQVASPPQATSATPARVQKYAAAGILSSAVIIAAHQSHHLGSGISAIQLVVTLISLSFVPYLYHTDPFARLSRRVSITVALVMGSFFFTPVLVRFILELFTGHHRKDSGIFGSMWRIYAILGLWIVFAKVNEGYIRPWWRVQSEKLFGGWRAGSIAAEAQRRSMSKRTARLEGIKARVAIALRKKKRIEDTQERKEKDVVDAEQAVARAEVLLKQAQTKAEQRGDGAGSSSDDVDRCSILVESARARVATTKSNLQELGDDAVKVEEHLAELQGEWTEALHIDNYTTFYR